MQLSHETQKRLLESIKRFFAEEMEMDIGDLKAMKVLDFCKDQVGPSFYNLAISDAQAFMQERVSDLDGVLYEPEPRTK